MNKSITYMYGSIIFIVGGILIILLRKHMARDWCEWHHKRGLFEGMSEVDMEHIILKVAAVALVSGLLMLVGALWKMLWAMEYVKA